MKLANLVRLGIYKPDPNEGKCLWKNFVTGKLKFMEINSV